MANNNKLITPGLYTRIEDLSQATTSIGTTTLGLVGETLKGPAFEPIKISNKNEFLRIFGGQSPLKKGSNFRYELPYVANSFLEESNQLYVTRVLGLGGYVALTPYVLTTLNEDDEIVILAVIRSSKPITLGSNPKTGSTVITRDGKSNTVSFLENDKKNIENVLKRTPNTDIYLESYFQSDVDGLEVVTLDVATSSDKTAKFDNDYLTPVTPYIVSDLDTNVEKMFRFISISDGDNANYEIKISIENVDSVTREFDVIIRDYNDTDKNPSVLESFRRCSMNPSLSSYIGKRIGTYDGFYTLASNYVSVDVNEECPITAIPCGMYPFEMINYANGGKFPLTYKLSQDADALPRELRRNYLGWDFSLNSKDIVKFHGTTALPTAKYKGFHIEDISTYANSTDYDFPSGVFVKTNPNILCNRFTVPMMGGFDGFDIFKTSNFYKNLNDDDSKAFLQATKTMMNPDDVAINIFATPGLNYYDNNNLILSILDSVEEDRGDTVYFINSPDYTLDSTGDIEAYAQDMVDMLDLSSIDTFYGTTYASYLLHYDVQNGVNVYLPPTFDVLRSLAEVDRKKAPWFAVAGYNNGLLKSKRTKQKINSPSSDILYKGRINPIKMVTNQPIVLGNKTLQVTDSALNRLNVVRCVLQIQKLVATVAVKLLFEPLDDELQSKFKSVIEPILEDVRKQRGLISFEVICDKSNNTDADRDQLQLNGYILIKPTNATEYISIGYGVTNQGATFNVK